jgi:hypothetical protein
MPNLPETAGAPQVVQHQRFGHKMVGASGIYSHATRPMIEALLSALQQRWRQHGTWSWADGLGRHRVARAEATARVIL